MDFLYTIVSNYEPLYSLWIKNIPNQNIFRGVQALQMTAFAMFGVSCMVVYILEMQFKLQLAYMFDTMEILFHFFNSLMYIYM